MLIPGRVYSPEETSKGAPGPEMNDFISLLRIKEAELDLPSLSVTFPLTAQLRSLFFSRPISLCSSHAHYPY